jgi:hypothetical protein
MFKALSRSLNENYDTQRRAFKTGQAQKSYIQVRKGCLFRYVVLVGHLNQSNSFLYSVSTDCCFEPNLWHRSLSHYKFINNKSILLLGARTQKIARCV